MDSLETYNHRNCDNNLDLELGTVAEINVPVDLKGWQGRLLDKDAKRPGNQIGFTSSTNYCKN
jgi:hypothetical protein